MKQRQHRRSVQQRMAAAPTQFDLDCAFYGAPRWTRRELKAIEKRQAPPLVIKMLDPSMLAGRTFKRAGMPGHILVTDTYLLRPYQQAICDALTKGEGWIEIGVAQP